MARLIVLPHCNDASDACRLQMSDEHHHNVGHYCFVKERIEQLQSVTRIMEQMRRQQKRSKEKEAGRHRFKQKKLVNKRHLETVREDAFTTPLRSGLFDLTIEVIDLTI